MERQRGYMRFWTDDEVSTPVSMWREASIMHIAITLHRSPGSIHKSKQLRQMGRLKGTRLAKENRRGAIIDLSIKPDLQDFDAVKSTIAAAPVRHCRTQCKVQATTAFGRVVRLAQTATLSDDREVSATRLGWR